MKHLLAFLLIACFPSAQDGYLNWSEKQAEQIIRNMRSAGRVAGGQGLFSFKTDKSISFHVRATWFTPDAIRATTRIQQLRRRLSNEQTSSLVSRAESEGMLFLIEIKAYEGSGVIPDWQAFLQPKNTSRESVNQILSGVEVTKSEAAEVLAGGLVRDFGYQQFWVSFPWCKNAPARQAILSNRQTELIIRIEKKEGRLEYTLPSSLNSASLCDRGFQKNWID